MRDEVPLPPLAFFQCAFPSRAWLLFARSVDDIGYRFSLLLFVGLWCAIALAPIYLFFEPIPVFGIEIATPIILGFCLWFVLLLVELILLSIRFLFAVLR